MSSVSQTPGAGDRALRRRLLVGLAATVVIVALAIGPAGHAIAAAALTARLHAPDLALFSRLPLAIKLHIFGALSALALGGVLMTRRKGRLFHRMAGWLWVALVSLVAGSSLFITSLNHGKWSILHLFTGWTLIILPLAVIWARRHAVARHRRAMMGLFYGGFAINLLIAFIPGRAMWMLVFG
jgi:uncharacterized membrane protein